MWFFGVRKVLKKNQYRQIHCMQKTVQFMQYNYFHQSILRFTFTSNLQIKAWPIFKKYKIIKVCYISSALICYVKFPAIYI